MRLSLKLFSTTGDTQIAIIEEEGKLIFMGIATRWKKSKEEILCGVHQDLASFLAYYQKGSYP